MTNYTDRLLGGKDPGLLEVDRRDYEALIAALVQGASMETVLARLECWKLEPIAKRLERVAEHARRLAQRMNKGDVQVKVDADDVRLDPKEWASF